MKSPVSVVLLLFVLFASLLVRPAFAIENDTITGIALKVHKALAQGNFVEASVTQRFVEGVTGTDRGIAEFAYGKGFGKSQISGDYSIQFNRNGQAGEEHRLYLQYRLQQPVTIGNVETWARVEERYFNATDTNGERLRIGSRWNRPLSGKNALRLGYEWVYNLNDISSSTQKGLSQDRLLGTFSHTLANGSRLDFDYQLRYLHSFTGSDSLQHQLQFTYLYNF